MPTFLPAGLMLAACLEREDARDVFVSGKARSLAELPHGATLGTTSPRRQAIARRARPDLRVVPLRGNVETRLRKLDDGAVDATILALAGLKRLGLADRATRSWTSKSFFPPWRKAPSASKLAPATRAPLQLLARIDHADTSTAVACERAFLAELDGSCNTPIAGNAAIASGVLQFRGLIVKPDGSGAHRTSVAGSCRDAVTIGVDAGRALRQYAGAGFFQ